DGDVFLVERLGLGGPPRVLHVQGEEGHRGSWLGDWVIWVAQKCRWLRECHKCRGPRASRADGLDEPTIHARVPPCRRSGGRRARAPLRIGTLAPAGRGPCRASASASILGRPWAAPRRASRPWPGVHPS